MDGTYRPTLVVLFIATLGGFAFAFITGFSIGRFVVPLPLLVTPYAVTYGRSDGLQLAVFASSALRVPAVRPYVASVSPGRRSPAPGGRPRWQSAGVAPADSHRA